MTNTTEYERATIMGTYQMYSSGGVSGDYRGVQVNASGQIILASGLYIAGGVTIQSGVILASGVYIASGQGVLIQSGAGVQVQSGIGVLPASGHGVLVQSGYGVIIASGLGVSISGQHVYVESGVYIASGIGVIINSGVGVTVQSGVAVTTVALSGSCAAISFPTAVAKGLVSGTTTWAKIGFNGGIGTTEEDMIAQGGVYVFPATAQQMMVKSTAEGDRGTAPIGSGAWSINMYYLDSGYLPQVEAITLNGTSGVNTTATDVLRINHVRVASVGGNAMPIGNLSITNLSGTITYGYVSSGQTRMRQCVYTVPASSTIYITGYNVSTNTVKEKYTKFTTRANFDDRAMAKTSGFFIPYNEIITVDTPFVQVVDPPTRIGQTTDLKVSAVAEAAGTATCALRGWLE